MNGIFQYHISEFRIRIVAGIQPWSAGAAEFEHLQYEPSLPEGLRPLSYFIVLQSHDHRWDYVIRKGILLYHFLSTCKGICQASNASTVCCESHNMHLHGFTTQRMVKINDFHVLTFGKVISANKNLLSWRQDVSLDLEVKAQAVKANNSL